MNPPPTPVYISVDLEFTNANNLTQGRVMQVGMTDRHTRALEVTLPVNSRHGASPWVFDNQKGLLQDCWERSARGDSLKRAVEHIREFVDGSVMMDRVGGSLPNCKPVMVTYCGGYDFAFLAQLCAGADLPFPFHHEMVDISSLAMGILDMPWGFSQTSLEVVLGVEPNLNRHGALADATHQWKLFQALLQAKEILHAKT